MKEITQDNYKDLKFDGIVVRVPNKVLQNPYDNISFIFECAYYSNSKHGYPKKGDNPDESSFYSAWYNDDYLPRGLMFNSTSRFTLDNTFKYWDVYNHYKFKDMEEFCTWYLQQKGCEIWTTSGDLKGEIHKIEPRKETTAKIKEDKEWIHEKCGTNTPPTSVPEHPSKGNKKSSFLDINELKIDGIVQGVLRGMIRDALKELTQKDKYKELNKINAESIYWDIYCEKETTSEMREKIEEIYPHFKEQ